MKSDWVDGSDIEFSHEWEYIRNDFIRVVPDSSKFTYTLPSMSSDADQNWYSIFIPSDPLIARKSLIYLIRKGIPDHLRHNVYSYSYGFLALVKIISVVYGFW